MSSRIRTLLTGLFALLTALLLALAPAGAKPASGGYQLFEPVASGHQAVISLAALENFDYHAKIAPECCNAKKGGAGRPTPKESEQYVVDSTGGRGQVSYKDGDQVSYGTKGSTRPDCVVGNCAIEVKNYDLSRPGGQSSLIRDTSNQVNNRAGHLPEGMTQEVNIDIRGQNLTESQLGDIRNKIVERTNGNLDADDIEFLRDP